MKGAVLCRCSSTPVNEEEKEEDVINLRPTVTGGSKCRYLSIMILVRTLICFLIM